MPKRTLAVMLAIVATLALLGYSPSGAGGQVQPAIASHPDAPASLTSCSGVNFVRSDVATGMTPIAVTVADFNLDGKPDLLVVNYALASVAVLLGDGAGGFGPPINSTVFSRPVAVAVGDFNRDGKPDIVVASFSAYAVWVLLGNGDGSFGLAAQQTVGDHPDAVVVADFNGDGKLDIAAANYNSSSVSVLLGNGDGSFQPAVNYPVGNHPTSIAVGDFNSDGKLDLVTANGSVSVLLGNGNGTFQPAVNYTVGTYPQSVVVGDLNADGKPDLAVSNGSSNNISVLLGNGDGTFLPAVNYAVGTQPMSVAIADFNLDGKPDLATANLASNNLSVLLGNGDGSFPPAVNFTVGNQPQGVTVGDFNLDGKPDLAVANNNSSNVSVLLNTCSSLTATPTNTPGGPTSTSVSTNTPLPSSTPAPTNTPSGPTGTPTPSPTSGGPTITPTPTDCANPFVDVSGNVFYVAIHYLNCRGVINGTDATHYTPDGTATRGQFAKIVVLGFGVPLFTPTGGQSFTDVPPGYFAYLYIESGYHAGILSGYDSASCIAAGATPPCYLPNRPITRGQLTKLVVLAAHYQLTTPTTPSFIDVPPSNVFYAFIETAHAHGVINGYPDHTFRPNQSIRRDEMAQIVYKGMTTP